MKHRASTKEEGLTCIYEKDDPVFQKIKEACPCASCFIKMVCRFRVTDCHIFGAFLKKLNDEYR